MPPTLIIAARARVSGRTGSVPPRPKAIRFASRSPRDNAPSARRRGQIAGLEIKSIAQVLARFQDALEERAVGFAGHQGLDQIELIHSDKLQDFGARPSGAVARQRLHHLDMLWRLWPLGR